MSIPRGMESPEMVDTCQPHKELKFEPECSLALFQ